MAAPDRTPHPWRWWLLGEASSFLVLWPVFSVRNPDPVLEASGVAGGMKLGALRWGSLVAALAMWREVLAVGVLLTGASVAAGLVASASNCDCFWGKPPRAYMNALPPRTDRCRSRTGA